MVIRVKWDNTCSAKDNLRWCEYSVDVCLKGKQAVNVRVGI
jgi:hypothetical protein